MATHRLALLFTGVCTLALTGCYAVSPSAGGGETAFEPPRRIDTADIALPDGYRIEPVATGLTFPTGVAFDDDGTVHVVESGYSYGEAWTVPRVVRVEPDGAVSTVAEGGRNGPWTAAVFHDGDLYIAEGGELEGGRILRHEADGEFAALVEDLPSLGDHHTNALIAGADGWLYFGQGTATNAGVVGPDNAHYGWLHRYPRFHDTPCEDITLTGQNYDSPDPLEPGGDEEEVRTGAYVPFGTTTESEQTIAGQVPCNGAILRLSPATGELELVAWGLRNPFGLALAPDGQLYATDNSYDVRGSRPIFGAGDLLWRIEPGAWYGWPDFHGETPVSHPRRYVPPDGAPPAPLLARHPGDPPAPAAVFAVHSSSNGLDFSRSEAFGHVGEAFVAQLGDMVPETGKVMAPVGFRVVRVNVETGAITSFAANRGAYGGPASAIGGGGLERPVAARFDPAGEALYVVDFGVMTIGEDGPRPQPETGVLWRIVPTGGRE